MSLKSLKPALFCLCMSPAFASAADWGVLTVADGQSHLLRDAKRYTVAEGVRIERGDILQTGPAAFVQVEFADGALLQLGPRTGALLRESKIYVLEGWVKRSASQAGKGPLYQTPALDLNASGGVTLMRSVGDDLKLFIESGETRLSERGGARIALKAGDFYTRKGSAKGQVAKRFDPSFVSDMPPSFRDTLPARRDLFKNKIVQPRPAPDFDYESVRGWLSAEPAIRRQFVSKWREKAKEPAFREALQANMRAHPEWDPVLNPEKYAVKTPPAKKTDEPLGFEVPMPVSD